MPQMAPISWLTLFLVFSITLILFCTMNYFSFLPPSPKNKSLSKTQQTHFNWKW